MLSKHRHKTVSWGGDVILIAQNRQFRKEIEQLKKKLQEKTSCYSSLLEQASENSDFAMQLLNDNKTLKTRHEWTLELDTRLKDEKQLLKEEKQVLQQKLEEQTQAAEHSKSMLTSVKLKMKRMTEKLEKLQNEIGEIRDEKNRVAVLPDYLKCQILESGRKIGNLYSRSFEVMPVVTEILEEIHRQQTVQEERNKLTTPDTDRVAVLPDYLKFQVIESGRKIGNMYSRMFDVMPVMTEILREVKLQNSRQLSSNKEVNFLLKRIYEAELAKRTEKQNRCSAIEEKNNTIKEMQAKIDHMSKQIEDLEETGTPKAKLVYRLREAETQIGSEQRENFRLFTKINMYDDHIKELIKQNNALKEQLPVKNEVTLPENHDQQVSSHGVEVHIFFLSLYSRLRLLAYCIC